MLRQSFNVHKGPGLALGAYEATGDRNNPIRFLTAAEVEKRAEQDFYWNSQAVFKELEERDPAWTLRMLPFWVQRHLLELDGLDPKIRKVLAETARIFN